MAARIDHFMYAVASLDDGMQWAADTFGAAPAYGGEHVGLGTRNALLSLGETYLEIIAPDPAQSVEGSLGQRFAELGTGGLVTWAVCGDLRAIAQTLAGQGVDTVGPNRTERQTAEGELLVWELLFPAGSPFGARMPFFIDWLECAHPSKTNPSGGQLEALQITTPDAAGLSSVLASIGLDVAVTEGEPGLRVTIAAPSGPIELTSTPETSVLAMR